MIWGKIDITPQIAQAAIDELYPLEDITAHDRLQFYNRHGFHFSNKEEIRAMAYQYQLIIPKKPNKRPAVQRIEDKPLLFIDAFPKAFRDFII